MSKPKLLEDIWFTNFDHAVRDLAAVSMSEPWDPKGDTQSKNKILKNYLFHTYMRLVEEGKIIETTTASHAIFNTGMCTNNYEEIFCLFEKNRKQNAQPWYFIRFCKRSDRDLTKFPSLPKRAHYFDDPANLLYDIRLDLRENIDHIIQDNISRFPSALSNLGEVVLRNILQGAIKDAIDRVQLNYKTAIPQYYEGKIQLLLPLRLDKTQEATLALVVQKEDGFYRASTVLTLDMAYNNARLIARPDAEWLNP